MSPSGTTTVSDDSTAIAHREAAERAKLIGRAALFSGLRASRLAGLAEEAWTQHLDAGDHLFHEGEPGGSMFVVASGLIRLSIASPDRLESTTLAFVRPADTFGEISVFDSGPRSTTAIAVEPTVLIGLPAPAVRQAVRDEPDLAESIICSLARMVRQTNSRRSDLIFLDLHDRVAQHLLTHLDDGEDDRVTLDLTHEELAVAVSGSVRAVNRVLQGFERDGLIELSPSAVIVLDRARLAAHVDHNGAAAS